MLNKMNENLVLPLPPVLRTVELDARAVGYLLVALLSETNEINDLIAVAKTHNRDKSIINPIGVLLEQYNDQIKQLNKLMEEFNDRLLSVKMNHINLKEVNKNG